MCVLGPCPFSTDTKQVAQTLVVFLSSPFALDETMSSTTLGNHSIMSCSPNDPLAHLVEVATALARMPQESGPARTVSSSSSSVGITTTTTTAQPAALGDSDYLSVVSNDEDESQKRTLSSPAASSQPYSKREIFPQRLLAILSDPSLCDVVAWLPHGKSFVIIRPDVFTEQVLPKYLPPTDARSSTKYASFTRKLNRWYAYCLQHRDVSPC